MTNRDLITILGWVADHPSAKSTPKWLFQSDFQDARKTGYLVKHGKNYRLSPKGRSTLAQWLHTVELCEMTIEVIAA